MSKSVGQIRIARTASVRPDRSRGALSGREEPAASDALRNKLIAGVQFVHRDGDGSLPAALIDKANDVEQDGAVRLNFSRD